ncbi:malate dehydrogenase (quinone) [Tomitella biformata]|uniref:malate dehydrogenase (quinone) n=1 Tax=Tomitella biformata TaxID=630403 RepID=UPI000467D2D1|nr:malate dehydrogenase (quinone) [Tomitella biformata]
MRTTTSVTGDASVRDVVLIGGGIMSATLGAMLARLEPDWSITMLERLGELAGESSGAWNNAGTGHSGLCELNYMPDPDNGSQAEDIARQFHQSRQFWASLAAAGDLTTSFINPTPHMDVVFGEPDVEYLRRRHQRLQGSPLFSAMEFSTDPAVIGEWAPLLMAGRKPGQAIAANRYAAATDVDFGALTTELARASGAQVALRHEVSGLKRGSDGLWTVTGRELESGTRFRLRSRFVFVGAGGYALKLLQKARIPEVRGYGVFPLGAQFLRTENPEVVARHEAKVYSQVDVGAPPMSVPHLDRREVDGVSALMFGPYATFSTRLLKHGKLIDLFTTIRPGNIVALLAVGLQNLALVRYLVGQLLASPSKKFRQLARFYPEADPRDWEMVQAGQRAQLIKPDRKRGGVLMFGTELVTGANGTIAGLLGASPGASIAPSAMADLLGQCFPRDYGRWAPALQQLLPSLDTADQGKVDAALAGTARELGLG